MKCFHQEYGAVRAWNQPYGLIPRLIDFKHQIFEWRNRIISREKKRRTSRRFFGSFCLLSQQSQS